MTDILLLLEGSPMEGSVSTTTMLTTAASAVYRVSVNSSTWPLETWRARLDLLVVFVMKRFVYGGSICCAGLGMMLFIAIMRECAVARDFVVRSCKTVVVCCLLHGKLRLSKIVRSFSSG